MIVSISAVDLERRVALADDGAEFPIINMLDVDGEETADFDLCMTIVVRLTFDLWLPLGVKQDARH